MEYKTKESIVFLSKRDLVTTFTFDWNCLIYHPDSVSDFVFAISEVKPLLIVIDAGNHTPQVLASIDALSSSTYEAEVLVITTEADLVLMEPLSKLGIHDVLVSPFSSAELALRIQNGIDRIRQRKRIAKKLKESEEVTSNAVEQVYQISKVLHFIKKSEYVTSLDELVEYFFDAIYDFQISVVLKVTLPKLEYFKPEHAPVSEEEQKLLDLSFQTRLTESPDTLTITGKNLSLLITHQFESSVNLDQIKDTLVGLVESLEIKLQDLNVNLKLRHMLSELNIKLVSTTEEVMNDTDMTMARMRSLAREIAMSYHSIDLTEYQENFLNILLERELNKLSDTETQLTSLKSAFDSIVKQFNLIVSDLDHSKNNARYNTGTDLFTE